MLFRVTVGGLERFTSRAAAAAPRGVSSRGDGTFAFFDVSGFTTLAERLGRLGAVGSELTTTAVNSVLAPTIAVVLEAGGDVLTFGGDAVSVLFTGEQHERRAAWTAAQVQRVVRDTGRVGTPAGEVRLRMSMGLHLGAPRFVVADGERFAPSYATGTVVTTTLRMEALAPRGTVAVSPELAARLPRSWTDPWHEGAFRLRLAAPTPLAAPAPVPEPAAYRLSPHLLPALEGDAAAEHRPATVAFVALPGTDALPDQVLVERLERLTGAVEEVCDAYGLCSLDTDLGQDQVRVVLTAGAPVLADRDEERMLLAVHDLAGRGLGLRIGVNGGRLFAGEVGGGQRACYTVQGDVVNVAARLMARSVPDRPLVGAEVLRRSTLRFAATRQESLTVKNRRGAVPAVELGSPLSRDEGDTSALVGRESELAHLRKVLESDGALAVTGPPGLGKSRLVTAAVSSVRSRRTAWLTGHPYRGSSALSAFEDLLDDKLLAAVADLDEAVRGAWVRTALVEAVLTRNDVVVVEDLHWLDDASRAVVDDLARAAAEGRAALVVTTRPDLPLPEAAEVLELAPLDDGAARALAVDLLGEQAISDEELRRLVQRAQGNPLFLRELVGAWWEGGALSDTLEQVLGARIDQLDPVHRRFLREVAVGGDQVPVDVVGDVLGDVEPQWAGLRGFLSVEGGRVSFEHDLVRAVAYGGLPFSRRAELHGAYADRLAGGPDPDSAVVAGHYALAGLLEPTWRWSLLGARQARQAGAWVEAADLLEGALRAAPALSLSAEVTAQVLEDYGDVCERLGRPDAAVRAFSRALAAVTEPEVRGRLERKTGRVEQRRGRYRAAMVRFGRAERALASCEEALAERAAVLLGQSYTRLLQGRLVDGLALAERGLREAELARSVAQRAQAHMQLEMLLADLGRPGGAAHGEAALSLFTELGDDVGRATVLFNLGVSAANEHAWQVALGRLEEAEAAFRLAAGVVGLATTLNSRAEILTDQGRYDDALACLLEARRNARAASHAFVVATTTSGEARIRLRTGDASAAADLLARAHRQFGELGMSALLLDTQARQVEVLAFAGDADEALALADRTRTDVAAFGGLPVVTVSLQRWQAIALARLGRADDAVVLLGQAVEQARAEHLPFEVAQLLDTLAWARDEPRSPEVDEICARLGVVALPELP